MPDGLPNCILRDFAPLLSQLVCAVFNTCLKEGFFPECWKLAEVIPARRRQRLTLRARSRMTSALFLWFLLWEKSLRPWVNNAGDSAAIIWQIVYQFVGIKGRSTAHALIYLLHEWMETIDAGGSVRTMFVDFWKTFDHVDHNLLISKLLPYDTPHCIIRRVHSYLSTCPCGPVCKTLGRHVQ